MKTLGEMLADTFTNLYVIDKVKETFKEWLKEVGLPLMTSFNKHGETTDATESIRKLLITLVDEP